MSAAMSSSEVRSEPTRLLDGRLGRGRSLLLWLSLSILGWSLVLAFLIWLSG